MNLSKEVALAKVPVKGYGLGKTATIAAKAITFVASAFVKVVSKTEMPPGVEGKFKGYRFEVLDRKVQTMFDPEGYILINTNDPTNKRYFGDEPYKAVEVLPHCQVRLADLILDECLQMMVSAALDNNRLEQRFPDSPEVDIRNYVLEKKFEIGSTIHSYFVNSQTMKALVEDLMEKSSGEW